MDHGFRAAIVAAIVAEAMAVLSLSAYLAMTGISWRGFKPLGRAA